MKTKKEITLEEEQRHLDYMLEQDANQSKEEEDRLNKDLKESLSWLDRNNLGFNGDSIY